MNLVVSRSMITVDGTLLVPLEELQDPDNPEIRYYGVPEQDASGEQLKEGFLITPSSRPSTGRHRSRRSSPSALRMRSSPSRGGSSFSVTRSFLLYDSRGHVHRGSGSVW